MLSITLDESSDLFMPLSGTVTEINPDLNANPELVNSDPYGAGWMVKVSLTNAGDFETLLSSEEYKQQIGV
jgi:glycine cleavage system H protein